MKIETVVMISLLLVIASASAAESKINADLQIPKSNEKVPVIIILKEQPEASQVLSIPAMQSSAEKSQKVLKELLEKARLERKASDIKSLWIANAIVVKASPELIYSIAARNDVVSIEPVRKVHIVEQSPVSVQSAAAAWGVSKINAPMAWQQGINGSGITVAVIDTGIDARHPDLDDLDDNPATNDPKVVGWIDYINGPGIPYDDNGHGTHVSGIISGTKGTGVAPGTKLIVAKVLDASGSGTDADVANALQWALINRANIISLSLGGSHSSLMTTAVNNAINAGVAVVAAAGNGGPGEQTIDCPGDEKNAITVGATDINDNIADFSGRGPVNWVGDLFYGTQSYIKPDVSAPGVSIYSTLQGGGYGTKSGTSMATPHVSGTAALILQGNPGLSPLELKQRLENKSLDLGNPGKDNTYGAGRIDAYLASFVAKGVIYGVSFNDSNGNKIKDTGEQGLADWTIRLSGFANGRYVSKTVITGVNGNFSFVSPPGKYTVMEVFKPGWRSTTSFYYQVSLKAEDSVELNFGNKRW